MCVLLSRQCQGTQRRTWKHAEWTSRTFGSTLWAGNDPPLNLTICWLLFSSQSENVMKVKMVNWNILSISKQFCLKRLTEYYRSLASRHLLQPDNFFLRSHVCGFFVSQSLISKTGVLKMIVFFFSNFFIPEILDECTDASRTMFWRILGKFLN